MLLLLHVYILFRHLRRASNARFRKKRQFRRFVHSDLLLQLTRMRMCITAWGKLYQAKPKKLKVDFEKNFYFNKLETNHWSSSLQHNQR